MIRVVGVRFKKAGKVYYFDPAEYPIAAGARVVVETARGVEYGEVAVGPKDVTEEQVVQPLKRVVRIGSEKDAIAAAENKRKEKDAFAVAQKRIQNHSLDMNLVDVEYTFDASKMIFYFTAEGRIDFRELVRDLAGLFRTRIEMRQIGVRDEAKLLGGIGPCGRILCCTSFLGDFAPVSIRMAKDQNLSLNPSKISGLCGRLMCCLRYEQETYDAAKKDPTLAPSYVPPQVPEEALIDADDLDDRPSRIMIRSDNSAGVSARIAQAAGIAEMPQRRASALSGPQSRSAGESAPARAGQRGDALQRHGSDNGQRRHQEDARPGERSSVERPKERRGERNGVERQEQTASRPPKKDQGPVRAQPERRPSQEERVQPELRPVRPQGQAKPPELGAQSGSELPEGSSPSKRSRNRRRRRRRSGEKTEGGPQPTE